MKRTPNIRKVSTKKARRNRECWRCGEKILKGSNYVNVEERYDKTIITFSYHESCYNYMLFNAPLNILERITIKNTVEGITSTTNYLVCMKCKVNPCECDPPYQLPNRSL